MSLIHKLDSKVVDQIAAGEVVERPAHLVKELIENSIDAQANKITIEVGQGGRQVKVVDNGVGMSKEDLPKSLERFATSKISQADDLWKLKSFGFRGEALASISSVCKLTVTSRQKESPSAFKLQSVFGELSTIEVSGGSFGTSVFIQDLFENVPARLKFMKSDSAEVSQIKLVIKALALAHPNIEFQLKTEDHLSLLYPQVATLKERAEQVLEQDQLFESSFFESNIQIQTVFSGPSQVMKTSRQIWIFAQNRWIQDRSLQTAVIEAYRHLLMHGEYPMAVVKIQLPTEDVDVNIHPTKSMVKFQDPQKIFRLVLHTIKQELSQAPWMQNRKIKLNANNDVSSLSQSNNLSALSNQGVSITSDSQPVNLSFQDPALDNVQYQKKDFFFSNPQIQNPRMLESLNFNSNSHLGPVNVIDLNYVNKNYSVDSGITGLKEAGNTNSGINGKYSLKSQSVQTGFWSRLEVLGQAALTYIIAQSDQCLYLIDQHAAHERIQFEKLLNGYKNGQFEIQEYLFPLVMDFSPEQTEVFLKLSLEFQKLGIALEQMGPQSLGIKSAPAFLRDSSVVKALEKMSLDITQHGHLYSFESSVGDIIATMACHSSVRAGQSLSLIEMKELLIQMDLFPLSSYCPHGRPVMIEQSFQKIETDFGRRGS